MLSDARYTLHGRVIALLVVQIMDNQTESGGVACNKSCKKEISITHRADYCLRVENDWKETLAKMIPDQTQRAIAKNYVSEIESAMTIISRNVRNLNEATDFKFLGTWPTVTV